MKKRWVLLLVTGIILGILTGCGKDTTDFEQEVNEVIEEIPVGSVDSAELPEMNDEEIDMEEPSVFFADAELTCTLPKGFEAHPEEPGLYVYKTYPSDSSTISYIISESDFDITGISKDEFKQQLEEDFYSSYGDEVVVDISEFNEINVNGRNGLRIMMSYEFKGVKYEQLMYTLYNGKESHILNYTQEEGEGWMEEFVESGETIAFTN